MSSFLTAESFESSTNFNKINCFTLVKYHNLLNYKVPSFICTLFLATDMSISYKKKRIVYKKIRIRQLNIIIKLLYILTLITEKLNLYICIHTNNLIFNAIV